MTHWWVISQHIKETDDLLVGRITGNVLIMSIFINFLCITEMLNISGSACHILICTYTHMQIHISVILLLHTERQTYCLTVSHILHTHTYISPESLCLIAQIRGWCQNAGPRVHSYPPISQVRHPLFPQFRSFLPFQGRSVNLVH